jgi:hypothetical protein
MRVCLDTSVTVGLSHANYLATFAQAKSSYPPRGFSSVMALSLCGGAGFRGKDVD